MASDLDSSTQKAPVKSAFSSTMESNRQKQKNHGLRNRVVEMPDRMGNFFLHRLTIYIRMSLIVDVELGGWGAGRRWHVNVKHVLKHCSIESSPTPGVDVGNQVTFSPYLKLFEGGWDLIAVAIKCYGNWLKFLSPSGIILYILRFVAYW